MDRKQIITFAVLTIGVVTWHMGAMEQGKKAESSAQSASAPQEVTLETSDGLLRKIDINVARKFGLLNRIIEKRLKGEPETLTFLGEIEISSEPSPLEVPIELHITKPVLVILLADLTYIEASISEQQTFLQRLRDKGLTRAHQTFLQVLRDLVRTGLWDNDVELKDKMERTIAYLKAASYLEQDYLIKYYAYDVAYLLTTPLSRFLLNNEDYALLEFVKALPVELQNEISEGMQTEPAIPLSSIATLEQRVWLALLTSYSVRFFNVTPWVVRIWRTLNEDDKNVIRTSYPAVAEKLEQQLNIGEVKRPFTHMRWPKASSSSDDNQ